MNDFIEEYPNTLSHIDCQKIISWFENSKNISLGKVGDGVIDISKKDCSEIKMNFLKDPKDINFMILNYLIEGLKKYKKKNPEINDYITLGEHIHIGISKSIYRSKVIMEHTVKQHVQRLIFELWHG